LNFIIYAADRKRFPESPGCRLLVVFASPRKLKIRTGFCPFISRIRFASCCTDFFPASTISMTIDFSSPVELAERRLEGGDPKPFAGKAHDFALQDETRRASPPRRHRLFRD
jgi:hypothetical protein